MPRASREASERTERKLRTQARRLLVRDGYAALRLDEVAAAAGVTRGAVYHHFENKQGLFVAVLADVHASVAAAVAAAATGEGWDAVEAGCVAFLQASLAPDVRRVLLTDGPAVLGWQEWRRLDAQGSQRLLREGLDALDDLAVDVGAATAVLSGAMNELALWLADGGSTDVALATLRHVLHGLRADGR